MQDHKSSPAWAVFAVLTRNAPGEPPPEERHECGRVDSPPNPILVRRPRRVLQSTMDDFPNEIQPPSEPQSHLGGRPHRRR